MPVKDQALPRICIRCLHVMGVLLSWKCDVSEGLHVSTLTLAGHFPTSSLCFHRFLDCCWLVGSSSLWLRPACKAPHNLGHLTSCTTSFIYSINMLMVELITLGLKE